MRWWGRRRARRAPALLAVLLGLGLLSASCGGAAQPPAASESRSAPNTQSAHGAAAPSAPTAATSGQAAVPAERAAPTSAAPAVDPDTQNTSLRKTTVAYSSYANAFAPLYVAAESGLFAKYGLDTELTYVGSATIVTQGLLAGDIAVAGVGPSVIDSRLAGSDLVIIADLLPVLLFTM